MKKLFIIILVIALPSLLSMSSAQAVPVFDTFDSGTSGWISEDNGTNNVTWSATGGTPDGHIRLLDKTSGWGYFEAPAKYLVPLEYGGLFTFNLRVANNADDPEGTPYYPNIYNVRTALQGNGFTLINELSPPPSTDAWTTYNFTLDEGEFNGWRVFSDLAQNYHLGATQATEAQFKGVIANLTGLFIAGDYSDGFTDLDPSVIDETWLDGVQVEAAAVPEPSTWMLMGIGFVGLAMYGYRRNKKNKACIKHKLA